jgi:type III restriction enzyme
LHDEPITAASQLGSAKRKPLVSHPAQLHNVTAESMLPAETVPMPRVAIIENPIINSPFEEPRRHFKFNDDGITDEIVDARRTSAYFVPIAHPKKKTSQPSLDTEWTEDRLHENDNINYIRGRVSLWRERGFADVTPVTRALLEHWKDPDRERRLYYCQVEALETLIFLNEVADKSGDSAILNEVRHQLEASGTPLLRLACKMATGTGKTIVMAMLVAYHTLNKRASQNDRRFSDTFLVVAPGITIRDRLRVLLFSDPQNAYQDLDLVPPEMRGDLGTAKIVITNFHAFKPREKGDAGRFTKTVLGAERTGAFVEDRAEMVRRVCRELGSKKEVIVFNDEAHHCYRSKPALGDLDDDKLVGDDRRQAQHREEEARLWLSGLEAVHESIGVKVAYDLSATPFYLAGSGYREGTLFPWVVSDFALIDAIESGIVKIPRVPISDDSMTGDLPTYRNIWGRIRDYLPKKGRSADVPSGPPKLPVALEGALRSLYGHYEKSYRKWQRSSGFPAGAHTPPVFIVVCANTSVSKLVFDWIAGFETEAQHPEGAPIVAPGNLPIFNNEDHGRWVPRPNSILVDSEQLESDEGMSSDFKKLAAAQIEEFKADLRQRFPGRDAENLTDQDLMREVMNTVGKAGKLGESIKCVVSVSMLTEGWDANTVTHILGVRAFSTQLLCEQVVGRGLRRMGKTLNEEGRFDPEYAEVYGIPFSFIPCAAGGDVAVDPPPTTRVRAVPERIQARPYLEIVFPRLIGYRLELPQRNLSAKFTEKTKLELSTADVPVDTEIAPIVGETVIHSLGDLSKVRMKEVVFRIAKVVLEQYFPANDGRGGSDGSQAWLFPQLIDIVERWLDTQIVCKDKTFPQMLLLAELAHRAAERIHRAIAAAVTGEARLRAMFPAGERTGSSAIVGFDTVKKTWLTSAEKCHVSHVACDSGWETKLAQTLEEMPEVMAYVKNQGLGFKIPYTLQGKPRMFHADYLLRVDDGHGIDNLLNLVVEVSGRPNLEEKKAKSETARTLWVPAVNNEGTFSRWAFLENLDPWNAQKDIREFIRKVRP